jgi:hypothetical protein
MGLCLRKEDLLASLSMLECFYEFPYMDYAYFVEIPRVQGILFLSPTFLVEPLGVEDFLSARSLICLVLKWDWGLSNSILVSGHLAIESFSIVFVNGCIYFPCYFLRGWRGEVVVSSIMLFFLTIFNKMSILMTHIAFFHSPSPRD